MLTERALDRKVTTGQNMAIFGQWLAPMNTIKNTYVHSLSVVDGVAMPLDLRTDWSHHSPMTVPAEHTHSAPPFNRLFLFTEGGFCDVVLDGRTRRLDADCFWLIPVYRAFRVSYPACGFFTFVHFTARAASGKDIFSQLPDIVSLPRAPALSRRFTDVFSASSPIGVLQFPAIMLEIVARFADRPDVLALWRENSLNSVFRTVLEHIREHNRRGLRITELARLVGMTPDTLRKGFRRNIGVPLKTYMLSELLHRSLDLLTSTDLSIWQIADRLGYEDPSHFVRAFKRTLHVSPLRYRKNSNDWIGLLADDGHPPRDDTRS